jgi:hypothetical protein
MDESIVSGVFLAAAGDHADALPLLNPLGPPAIVPRANWGPARNMQHLSIQDAAILVSDMMSMRRADGSRWKRAAFPQAVGLV